MKYKDLLKQYIENSGLSLSAIEEKMKLKGLSTNKAYISKLQNGKLPPAGEEINRALAEVTGGNEEKLVMAAYLEKAPIEFKSILNDVVYEVEKPEITVKEDILNYGDSYDSIKRQIADSMSEELRDNFIKKVDSPEKLVEFIKDMTINNGTSILNAKAHDNNIIYLVLNDFLRKQFSNNDDLDLIPTKKIIEIPVLGHISAGKPIFAEEHIEEFTSIPNPGKYNQNELFMLRVKGDSMTGSRIYDGDKVLVKIQPDVENGEIAVVNVNGYEATLKKVKKMPNGQVLLMPSNDKYEPILVDDDKARVIGKVIQVIFEP